MKQLFLYLVLALTISSCGHMGKSQLTQGKVTYTMTLSDTAAAANKGMNGVNEVIYFKDSSARIETKSPMGDVVVLSNAKTGVSYSLMGMMGQKLAMKMSKTDLEEYKKMRQPEKPTVELKTDTKTIAGYNCKRAIVHMNSRQGEQTTDVWYTNEIDIPGSTAMDHIEGVNGFPMEFTNSGKGTGFKMTCTSVEKIAVADSLFNVPKDYTVKDMKELMGGGGAQQGGGAPAGEGSAQQGGAAPSGQ